MFPWDEAVGLTPQRLTPAAERVVRMAGVACNSFAEAADHVPRVMAGLRLSESAVQRTAEDAGERVGGLPAAGKTLVLFRGRGTGIATPRAAPVRM